MIVQVTQEDIDHGQTYSCRSCPVALAMSRAFGKPVTCSTDTYWFEPGVEFPLPGDVECWICDFDCGIKVLPMEFTV